jgi:hypothetical protein
MKASDIQTGHNVSLLLKGPWGFGKTIAAASFALDGPVFLAYWDKKSPIELVNYFRRMGKKGKRILDNIEYEVYGANNANEYLNKVIDTAKNPKYFAFITDSITNMTSGAVNWSLSFRDDRKNKEKLKVLPDWDEYKVETSLVTQSLDLFRTMPCYVIFTCHPISSTKIEGSGGSIKISKVNKIVSYGSKVGDIVPGNFSEIYHFSKQSSWDGASGKSNIQYLVSTDVVGDDYAKSNIGLKGDIDITDGLFYEVWKEKVKQHNKEIDDAVLATEQSEQTNTFKVKTESSIDANITDTSQPQQTKWRT